MIKLFKTDGKVIKLKLRHYSLQEIQEMVGGYVELVRISNNPYLHAYVNEDGLMLKLKINEAFNEFLLSKTLAGFNPIVGNAILIESYEDMLIMDGQMDSITKQMITEDLL